jgi:dynein heavy chain
LEDVQSAINKAASHVLKSTKSVQNWNQKDIPEAERDPFYDWIAKDKEIVKVILLLTGSIQGTKNSVKNFLTSFEEFNWLWRNKIDDHLKKFNASDPQLEDYENKLREFSEFEAKIQEFQNMHQISALSLTTANVKNGLNEWIKQWKGAYSKDLHKKARHLNDELLTEINHIKLKIEKPVKDIDSLGIVMTALEDIRKKESEIELQFRPVIEMYSLLESYLPPEVLSEKEEKDPKTVLEKDWVQLVKQATHNRNDLTLQQAEFKKSLISGVNMLIDEVADFSKNFTEKGPKVPGIEPREALSRLAIFKEEYSIKKRKYDSYHAGETLFGLPNQKYKDLEIINDEIVQLDKLYMLYSKVKDNIAKFKEVAWVDVKEEIQKMSDQMEIFDRDCRQLPGKLKSWDAYKELKQEIEDMAEIIPLVEALAKESIRPRHWEAIIELCK